MHGQVKQAARNSVCKTTLPVPIALRFPWKVRPAKGRKGKANTAVEKEVPKPQRTYSAKLATKAISTRSVHRQLSSAVDSPPGAVEAQAA